VLCHAAIHNGVYSPEEKSITSRRKGKAAQEISLIFLFIIFSIEKKEDGWIDWYDTLAWDKVVCIGWKGESLQGKDGFPSQERNIESQGGLFCPRKYPREGILPQTTILWRCVLFSRTIPQQQKCSLHQVWCNTVPCLWWWALTKPQYCSVIHVKTAVWTDGESLRGKNTSLPQLHTQE